MARHTASTRDTSVRSRPLAQCRYGRPVRHHLARVNKWVRLPLPAPSSWVFWSVGLRARHDAQHRVHGGLQNRTGSDHPRRASRSHRRMALRLLSACGQVRSLMGALSMSRSSSRLRNLGSHPRKTGSNPVRDTMAPPMDGTESTKLGKQVRSLPGLPLLLPMDGLAPPKRDDRVRSPTGAPQGSHPTPATATTFGTSALDREIRLVRFQHRRPRGARSLVRASALQAEPAGFDPLAPHRARVAQPAEAADLNPAQCSFESSRAHPPVRPVAAARLIDSRHSVQLRAGGRRHRSATSWSLWDA